MCSSGITCKCQHLSKVLSLNLCYLISILETSLPLLESWQESLMQCTSTSQLFVQLGTLERSIAWSRSVLKAHCRICRRRGDAENMLLCDGCNRGHHLYCLKPPLEVTFIYIYIISFFNQMNSKDCS